MEEKIKGRLHSVESFGAVDGPGIRYVAFFQGCNLKCAYCHNPDTWCRKSGKEITAEDLVKEILTYKNYIKSGGVTLSGGEPFLQPKFLYEVIRLCKQNGIHTAIDTSGVIGLEKAKPIIDLVDMILLDIKEIDTEDAKKLTGVGNELTLGMLDYCEQIGKRVWVRHVLVPGYTLKYDKLERMAEYLSKFKCIEKVELLPFHKMGEYKWEVMNQQYKLFDTQEPTDDEVRKAKEIFLKHGLTL